MSVTTRIVLALVVLLIGVMALYYGYLLPRDESGPRDAVTGAPIAATTGETDGADADAGNGRARLDAGRTERPPSLRRGASGLGSSPDSAADSRPSLRAAAGTPTRRERPALGAAPSDQRRSLANGSGSSLRGPEPTRPQAAITRGADGSVIEMGGVRHGDTAPAVAAAPEKDGGSALGSAFRRQQAGAAGAAEPDRRTALARPEASAARPRLGTPPAAARAVTAGPGANRTAPAAGNDTNTDTNSGSSSTPGSWTVRSGDTLSGIAAAWFGAGHHWRLIAAANPKVDPGRMDVGQVLVLPPKSAVRPVAPERNDPVNRVDRRTLRSGDRVHTVVSGDTLSSIAGKYYGDVNAWDIVAEANRRLLGDNADRLDLGMELRIPRRP